MNKSCQKKEKLKIILITNIIPIDTIDTPIIINI